MGAPPRKELLPRVALEIEARAEMGPGYNAQCLLAATYFFWLRLVPHRSYNPPGVIERMDCLNTWDISHSNHSESLEGECPFPKKEEG